MTMETTPLQEWIAAKIGLPKGDAPDPARLRDYQLAMLGRTLAHARRNSPFYRRHLKDVDLHAMKSMADFSRLPFTFPRDLADSALEMLCVSQGEIARVVTLQTSGTTASPKRIYFTLDDLELTSDFFAQGMKALVAKPGQRVMVLMPGPNLGSVGERLSTGLKRIGCEAVVHGLVEDPGLVMEKINDLEIDCLIGLPVQVLSLARCSRKTAPGRIKSVLLSGDYVPRAITAAVNRAWNCPVFNHYGLTETGLGGGVECRALEGCHLREADLYLEIVDSRGRPVHDGRWGEIVLTTLTRTGMPLIRYRTGDISRFLTSRCACGSNLRRLDRVRGRSVYNLEGSELRLDEMDEAIFQLDDILDFEVRMERRENRHLMKIEFWAVPGAGSSFGFGLDLAIRRKLNNIPSLKQSMDRGVLSLTHVAPSSKKLFSNPMKRKIKRVEDAQEY
ncbi:MAG: phenylacetate--CoA ligase family protein [Desulfobacteraceae bacterium]|nr:phenylacetate--CoA ligase family protein [Desulfobacteraceae bacterium]